MRTVACGELPNQNLGNIPLNGDRLAALTRELANETSTESLHTAVEAASETASHLLQLGVSTISSEARAYLDPAYLARHTLTLTSHGIAAVHHAAGKSHVSMDPRQMSHGFRLYVESGEHVIVTDAFAEWTTEDPDVRESYIELAKARGQNAEEREEAASKMYQEANIRDVVRHETVHLAQDQHLPMLDAEVLVRWITHQLPRNPARTECQEDAEELACVQYIDGLVAQYENGRDVILRLNFGTLHDRSLRDQLVYRIKLNAPRLLPSYTSIAKD